MERPESTKKPPVVPASELTRPNQPVLDTNAPHISRWLLIALALMLIAILIGLVVWVRTLQDTPVVEAPSPTRPTVEENDEPESTTAKAVTETLQVMSPSTELSSIQADLDATIIEDLDGSLADIDALVSE